MGDTVVWTIVSGVHTITSHLPGFSTGALGPEETFSVTFDAPGAHPYKCAFHANMQGVVVVQ